MKKNEFFFFIVVIFLLFNCNRFGKRNSDELMTPDVVFIRWHEQIKKGDFRAALKYEFFPTENVKYQFEIEKGKLWASAGTTEKLRFITIYKKMLIDFLNSISPDEKKRLFKVGAKIVPVSYSVDLKSGKSYLYLKCKRGQYSIKLLKKKGYWKLYNPFGYHNYLER